MWACRQASTLRLFPPTDTSKTLLLRGPTTLRTESSRGPRGREETPASLTRAGLLLALKGEARALRRTLEPTVDITRVDGIEDVVPRIGEVTPITHAPSPDRIPVPVLGVRV